MKKIALFTLPLMLLFSVLNIGCQRKVDALDVLSKSISAVNEANSYVYIIDSEQEIIIPRLFFLTANYKVAGKLIKKPMAAEIDLQIDMTGLEIWTKMYIVDNYIYISNPDMGWVRQDFDEELNPFNTYGDPLRYSKILWEFGTDALIVEEKDNYYLLKYEDEIGPFSNLIKEEIQAQFFNDLIDDIESKDYLKKMIISDFSYTSLIDSGTYLPLEDTMTFNLLLEIMDETINVNYVVMIKYLEFGTLDTITVPEEVISNAAPTK